MSNLPTIKYPYVIEHQMFKKGRWSAQCSIQTDMGIKYAIKSLDDTRKLMPEHNWRLLVLEIIE